MQVVLDALGRLLLGDLGAQRFEVFAQLLCLCAVDRGQKRENVFTSNNLKMSAQISRDCGVMMSVAAIPTWSSSVRSINTAGPDIICTASV